MGKSVSGPGMLDCATYLIAVEEATSCSIAVLVEPVGSSVSASLRVGLVATSRELTVSGPAWSCSIVSTWPCRRHKTFQACLYASISELDARIGNKLYQETLNLA